MFHVQWYFIDIGYLLIYLPICCIVATRLYTICCIVATILMYITYIIYTCRFTYRLFRLPNENKHTYILVILVILVIMSIICDISIL